MPIEEKCINCKFYKPDAADSSKGTCYGVPVTAETSPCPIGMFQPKEEAIEQKPEEKLVSSEPEEPETLPVPPGIEQENSKFNAPAEPDQPIAQEEPQPLPGTTIPSEPTSPTEPTQPVIPTEPAIPSTPTEPETSTSLTIPEKPDQPVAQEEPNSSNSTQLPPAEEQPANP